MKMPIKELMKHKKDIFSGLSKSELFLVNLFLNGTKRINKTKNVEDQKIIQKLISEGIIRKKKNGYELTKNGRDFTYSLIKYYPRDVYENFGVLV